MKKDLNKGNPCYHLRRKDTPHNERASIFEPGYKRRNREFLHRPCRTGCEATTTLIGTCAASPAIAASSSSADCVGALGLQLCSAYDGKLGLPAYSSGNSTKSAWRGSTKYATNPICCSAPDANYRRQIRLDAHDLQARTAIRAAALRY